MVLHGAIIKTKYQKSDNSWHIVHFKVMNNNVFTEDITATGYIPWSIDDDLIGLEGEYKTNDYGRQFVVTQSWMEMPITSNGAKKYLQNWVPGIGSSKAEALVRHFGTKLVSILNNEPDKLLECKGINNKIAANITECWQRDGLARKIGVFLSEHNISTVWRDRIVEKFGSMAVEKITANPYILTSIRGIGFSKADEIARKLGVKKNSSERIKACFIHVLTQWANDGHCFMHEGDLKEAVFKLTKAKPEILQEQLKNLIDNKEVIESSLSSEEINIKVIYLPYLYEDEVAVSKHIVRLLSYEITKHTKVTINNQDFSEQQKTGISNSFNNKISIVTGAPGTGKTSLVKGIVAICNKYGKTLALCAPTGRAAKRLAEVTGEEASTIHRLLEYNGETSEFNHNEDNELQYDVIIVDESSMIDIELANDLLSAIGKNTNIVFVGDIDQLPPVGPGSFLKDMIKSEKIETVKLDHIFRQAQKSLMVQNSHRIKNGEYPTFPPKGTETDSYLLTKSSSSGDDSEWADTALTMMITKNIPEKIKSLYNIDIDIKSDIQVLVPMKKGTYGVYEINKSLQKTLNPDGTVFNALGKLWRVGDKVLQNSNNYEYDIYNGDIGVITDYDIVDKTMTINFDGKLVTMPYKTVNDEMSLGYTMSIHKCIDPQTLVETSNGIIKAEDLPEEGHILTASGLEPYKDKVIYESSKTVHIETEYGHELTTSNNHGIQTWVGNTWERKEAKDLIIGNWLRLKPGVITEPLTRPELPVAPSHDVRAVIYDLPNEMTEELAEFLGLMVSDGTIFKSGFRLIKNHKEVIERFKYLCEHLFGAKPKLMNTEGTDGYEVSSTYLSSWLLSIGGLSPNSKNVPNVILKASSREQAKFLKGLFEDGTVNLKNNKIDHVEWCTCYKEMADTVQYLLLRLGIQSTKSKYRNTWRLYIYGSFITKYKETIGFIADFKSNRLNNYEWNTKETRFIVPIGKKEVKSIKKFIGISDYRNALNRGYITREVANKAIKNSDNLDNTNFLYERLSWVYSRITNLTNSTGKTICVEVPNGNRFLQNRFDGWNSQGSEYKVVIVILLWQHYPMLERNLLYTANTRAKLMTLYIAAGGTLQKAVDTNKVKSRNSLLVHRIKNDYIKKPDNSQ